VIEAVLFMLGLGVSCGSILSAASKVFYVYEDPRIAEVESKWPVQIVVDADMRDVPRLPLQLSKVRLHQAYAWLQGLKVPQMLQR
jgi:hypothetical protein